ncbi:NAD(P)/FAD-dependent oxidoreductase [Caballeronia sp. LZ033]|uniref:flavin-containing monooxygenase n=1 Tax=Caballeronia sp. LZ033 TaxID=3038566 RepID=UPI0028612DBD|nr:NAD(P)/FAD-dependent oxidoreductase [Caballeronia sp. LZ033]MDR5814138.1 NAD(P)/FAD-dependent oxidoreductase [Caballeronia sp. LZ033]
MRHPDVGQAGVTPDVDVIIVGAGFAGLYALYRFRKLGLRVRAFEAGSGIGGTWFWNRYPGARCDVDSLEYSYSFSDDLQQEWDWPDRFSTQADILRYIHHVADRFDLRRDIQLDTRVQSAAFDASGNRWRITTAEGQTTTARFCVMATGNLSLPRVPDFAGLESFKGDWHHTGRWPNRPVDFTGRRVGVIGTGSSGIQLIPIIAQQASELIVFQRTANFTLPARNRALSADERDRHKTRYGFWRAEAQNTPFGIAGHPAPTKNALDDTAEARLAKFEEKWRNGGSISFLYSYKDLLTSKAANDTAAEFVRGKIRSTVKDPATAELLVPKDHPIGARRLCLDTGYYETFNRPNVKLVDTKSAPIVAITETGVQTAAATYALDTIVFATGFDAITGALADIDIRGRDGLTLRQKWAHGPRTYLGLMTAGFPNLFIVTGPGSPSVKANMVCAIEQHLNWIAGCVAMLDARGSRTIEPDADAETRWIEHVNETADATLYPLAESWYTGANVPGKPRVFMPYVGGYHRYKAICEEVVRDGYRGFVISGLPTLAV